MPLNAFTPALGALSTIHENLGRTSVALPEAVTDAFTRWDRLRRTPRPVTDRQAILVRAGASMFRAVRTYPVSERYPILNAEKVLAPAELDQVAGEVARAEILVEVFEASQSYAAQVLLRLIDQNRAVMIEACQRRYRELAEQVWQASRALPPEFEAAMAAVARPELLEAWRTADAANGEMLALRQIVDDLDRSQGDADGDRFLAYTRSGVVKDETDFGSMHPRFGDLASTPGALALARRVDDPADLTLMTREERAARAADLWQVTAVM
jgi:hypothetical protein